MTVADVKKTLAVLKQSDSVTKRTDRSVNVRLAMTTRVKNVKLCKTPHSRHVGLLSAAYE